MVTVTENASKELKRLQQSENLSEGAGVRIGVEEGGCQGFSYRMDFAEVANPEDQVFESHGMKVFVDPTSYGYLKGLTLDFEGGLNGSGFSFINPNASHGCGCGSSFSVDE